MAKYIKKPVPVEAVQWTGTNYTEIIRFTGSRCQFLRKGNVTIIIPTLEGDMGAKDGDYIIRGVEGEFYPCRREIFEKTYEKVEN